jgi:hypothetical protein
MPRPWVQANDRRTDFHVFHKKCPDFQIWAHFPPFPFFSLLILVEMGPDLGSILSHFFLFSADFRADPRPRANDFAPKSLFLCKIRANYLQPQLFTRKSNFLGQPNLCKRCFYADPRPTTEGRTPKSTKTNFIGPRGPHHFHAKSAKIVRRPSAHDFRFSPILVHFLNSFLHKMHKIVTFARFRPISPTFH